MKEIILFIACFIVVFICYQVFFILPMKKYRKNKKNGKKKKIKEKKELAEIRFLVTKYKLDLDKVNYNKLLLVVSLVSSFDITLIVTIITLFDSYLVSFLLAAVLVLPIVMISYWLVYKFYEKKGMIKNV
jgi:membrane protein implicated in regulation of membrane protease activity